MTGHGIVLKSESHIRQEIDAKCAQDDQECAAIDDLEDLMNQRGGEWDFKKITTFRVTVQVQVNVLDRARELFRDTWRQSDWSLLVAY